MASHEYNMLDVMSKIGVNQDGWPDFHTELKLPRGVRKKLRRWVDRMEWPEGHSKEDARKYHITILSMDEYDKDFEKWARQQIRGKVFTFKSIGMDIFKDEHVVCRMDCPEWTELVKEWQEVADKKGLEPRKFDPPKAHVTIGKSPSGKWPQGIPNPHIKFDTRMFNINRNSAVDTTPADDLKAWLDSFTPEPEQPPSPHHTDADQFTPRIVAPVVQTPHVDPPSKPYKPYNWAEEGWEESPLNRQGSIDNLDQAIAESVDYGEMYVNEDEKKVQIVLGDADEKDLYDDVEELAHEKFPDYEIAVTAEGMDFNVWKKKKDEKGREHSQWGNLADGWKKLTSADPDWLKRWTEINGPYLYHYTHPERVKDIAQQGILPWDAPLANPLSESPWEGESLQPRPGHVYLSTNPHVNPNAETNRQGQLVVDMRKLDPSRFNPDEDAGVGGVGRWGQLPGYENLEHPESVETYKYPRGQWAEDNRLTHPKMVEDSMNRNGTVAYRGIVPPEAIVDSRIPDREPNASWMPSYVKNLPQPVAASAEEEMFVPGMARPPVTINSIGWPQSSAKPHMWNWEPQGHEPSRTPFLYNRNSRTIHLGRPGMIHSEIYNAAGVPSEGDVGGEWTQGELKHHPAELTNEPSWFTYGNPSKPDPDRDEIYAALQQHVGEPLRDIDAEHMPRSSAIDTHICPKCGEESDAPICDTCGYDPQHGNNDFQQAEKNWYDRAWSVPGNQPQPTPHELHPMHWRDDHAKNISLARKETNDSLGDSRRWNVESGNSAWQQIDDLPPLRDGESSSFEVSQDKGRNLLPGMRSAISGASALSWHGF